MSGLRFEWAEWMSYPEEANRETGETVSRFSVFVDDICLTRNEDIFTESVRDYAILSLHTLAIWFASSWWRLHYEILPDFTRPESIDYEWGMSHKMTAAGDGYIWPDVLFTPDRDEMHIWARILDFECASLHYLNGLSGSHVIPKNQFTEEVSKLIRHVISRLEDVGLKNSDLAQLWELIQSDEKHPKERQKRRIEAKLGFDPEECPDTLIKQALALEKTLGSDSFTELTGAYAAANSKRVKAIDALVGSSGVKGNPDIPDLKIKIDSHAPWKSAVQAASALRKKIGQPEGKVTDKNLCGLLGLSASAIERWQPEGRAKASLGGRSNGGKMKFITRPRRELRSRRFELARFIADYACVKEADESSWLVTSDVDTQRQKFQRAFAAELLCPIESLTGFLDDDFSHTAVRRAANQFQVSEWVVKYQLINNKMMHGEHLSVSEPETAWPYEETSEAMAPNV